MPKPGKSQKYFILFLVVLLIGIIYRSLNWGNFAFSFDQIQILENADHIIAGHLTLIGPRTGPAPLFTGPLIYYVAAGAAFFLNSPLALIGMKLINTVIIALGWLYLIRFFIPRKYWLPVAVLWAGSTYLIDFDHVPWNPNYTYLASALSFFPLYHIIKTRKLASQHLFSLFFSSWLGFQAHFSGLLLPVLVVLIWIIYRLKYLPILIATWSGLLLSLIPAFIFDLRHDWLHAKGLLSLFRSSVTGQPSEGFIIRLFHNLYVSLENIGKILIYHQPPLYLMVVGIVVCGLSLIIYFKQQDGSKLFPLLWLGAVLLLLTFYTKPMPEYYFFIQIPAIILMISSLVCEIRSSFLLLILFSVFVVLNGFKTWKLAVGHHALHFSEQYRVALYIQAESRVRPLKKVEYAMPYSDDWGLKYLLKDLPFSDTGQTVVITYPLSSHPPAEFDRVFVNGLGVKLYPNRD